MEEVEKLLQQMRICRSGRKVEGEGVAEEEVAEAGGGGIEDDGEHDVHDVFRQNGAGTEYGEHQSQPDVTSFQVDSFNPSSDGLTYERDAFVPSGSSYLSLIATDASGKPRTSSVGRVLYSNPVKFWDGGRQASFETTMRFAISPIDNDPVHGMTFFIIPVNSTKPTGGEVGNLGIFNAVNAGSPIFAIKFDVFVNSEDPNFRHISININSRVSRNVTNFQDAIG
ncbi:hypothetical protein ACS0TY_019012 [Phlomoides rotata]